MKAIKFKHHNIVYAENQEEYQSLPALKLDGPEGHVVSCWKMSFWERLKVLFTGKIWLDMMSFNQALTPAYLSPNRNEMFKVPVKENSYQDKWNKLIRKIEVLIKYFFYAIRKINDLHIGDHVIYYGDTCSLINGASNPYWKIMPMTQENLAKEKREILTVHSNHFEPIFNLRTIVHRFKFSWRFQLSNWYDVDIKKPIGTRISYLDSNDIKY